MNLTSGYEISELILRTVAIIVSLTVHEYAHAVVSIIQGDDTPAAYGRNTLNPMAHIDIMGLLSLFVFRFGWAKPVPIQSYNYKNPRRGIILTSLAGPFANFLLAFFSAVIFFVVPNQSQFMQSFLAELFAINCGLMVFNLIPFPPLDGSKVLSELFGGKVAEFMYKMERGGTFLLFMLLWLPPVQMFVGLLIGKAEFFIQYLAILVTGR